MLINQYNLDLPQRKCHDGIKKETTSPCNRFFSILRKLSGYSHALMSMKSSIAGESIAIALSLVPTKSPNL